MAGNRDVHVGDVEFRRLLSYYVQCVKEDEMPSISIPLSQMNERTVALPLTVEWNSADGPEVVIQRPPPTKRARDEAISLVYGYPLWVTAKAALPILIQRVEVRVDGETMCARLVGEWPSLNSEFVKDRGFDIEERGELLDDLGLLARDGYVPADRMRAIVERLLAFAGPQYEREPLDPDALAAGLPIGVGTPRGLYNRALLVRHESPRYVQGLLRELSRLGDLPDRVLDRSAMRVVRFGASGHAKPWTGARDPRPLLETFPLNDEQRTAAAAALERPLTVITGPPGTGKSQVVQTIIVNAVARGQRVLFASRNHQAVDVVEERLQAIDPDLIVRAGTGTGGRDLLGELEQRIDRLLERDVAPEAQQQVDRLEREVHDLLREREEIWIAQQQFCEAHNEVELRAGELAQLRVMLGPERWARFAALPSVPTLDELEPLGRLLQRHLERTSILVRVWRRLWRGRDLRRADRLAQALREHAELLPPLPESGPAPATLETWSAAVEAAARRVEELHRIIAYQAAVQRLSDASGTAADLAVRLDLAGRQLGETTGALVRAFLPGRASELTATERNGLGAYRAARRQLAPGNFTQDWQRWKRSEEEAFPAVSGVLRAWCVTNLSARGALPLKDRVFDLVVIDEASQCDIASALPLLFRAERAVVIGDPHQLGHITTLEGGRDRQLQAAHGLDTAAGQPFSFTASSLFDLLALRVPRAEIIDLREHFRSHADIIGFSNRSWYRGRLRVSTDYRRLVAAGAPAVRWTHVAGNATRPPHGSAVNQDEASAVVAVLHRLLVQERFQGSVGVVTPFRAQADLIRKLAQTHLQGLLDAADVRVATAHGFQGDERDVIVISPTLAANLAASSVRFLARTGNLFNVAITRARATLHVVGDWEACAACKVEHLRAFVGYVDELATAANGHEPESAGEAVGVLAEALGARGIESSLQRPFDQYRIALAIDAAQPVAVEIAGPSGELWTAECARLDLERDVRVHRQGWLVRRFSTHEICEDPERCAAQVQALIAEPDRRP